MNWDLFLKYLGYAFVISVYGLFAWTGRAPVAGFLVILTGVLGVLGASHLSSSAKKDASDAALKMLAAAQASPSAAPTAAPTVVVQQ